MKLLFVFLILSLLVMGCADTTVEEDSSSGITEEVVEGFEIDEIEDDIDALDELGDIEIPDDL